MKRRHFLMSSAAAVGAQMASHALASPNDTVRVACVGLHGQGNSHIKEYLKMENVEIAALCDIDESVLNKRLGEVEKASGRRPAVFTDYRRLLEDKSIDCVSIATPNFHHALQTIWGCQAGKDVYVEKPATHNIFEARKVVEAARKYNRIVQNGTNSRSTAALREGMQLLQEGVVGDVYFSRGLCYKRRDTIGRAPVEPVPAGVHYDLWQGPAQLHDFTKNRFHYNWHWFWEYGNGDFGNQGIHEVDVCRWGLGVKYPHKISAIGGHFMFDDDQETPNVLTATYEFNEGGRKKMMEFAVRHWISNHEAGIGEGKASGSTVGNLFYGSKGYMAVEDYDKFTTFLGREQQPGPSRKAGGSNWVNFIEAVRSRNRAHLNAEIEEGAISATLMHLANISYRVGSTLTFDSQSMTCVGDSEANRMFTRNYRKPFVVPEKV